jgi:microcystin-dependent protein
MPQHNHRLMADATTAATSNGGTPTGSTVLGNSTGTVSGGGAPFQVQIYSNAAANNILAPQAVGNTGTGTSHENRMPYLVVNFCMALQGIFPSRN